jgi:pimeloyl-ACP methyl ester carboxylesterase
MERVAAILLPGAVLPAGPAYDGLIAALGDRWEVHARDLEVYAGDVPPPDFSLATEVAGVLRDADEAGFERFHLVGYSAGGAVAIVLAARHPARVRTLAVMEPAWAGDAGMSAAEAAVRERIAMALALEDPDELMRGFIAAQLAPGVVPPPRPPGPPPPWMVKRPAGIRALDRAFEEEHLRPVDLRRFEGPVWFALGGRSNPDLYGQMAERLARDWPRMVIERFPERHHFDPPHRTEPTRVAAALARLWAA